MKLLSEVFKSVKKTKKTKKKPGKTKNNPCQLVSDLDVVGVF
jgi:hypothetical protein